MKLIYVTQKLTLDTDLIIENIKYKYSKENKNLPITQRYYNIGNIDCYLSSFSCDFMFVSLYPFS